MRDNEKNIHKMGAILQAKKAPEGEVKGAYENSGFSSGRCAAEVTKRDEKKGLTESDVLRALYQKRNRDPVVLGGKGCRLR